MKNAKMILRKIKSMAEPDKKSVYVSIHIRLQDMGKHLTTYKNLYICLDRDATTKAYAMAKDLRSSGFDNVIVKPLEDDLKYYNTKQIEEIFYDRKTNA